MLSFMRRHARSTTIKILFWVIIAVFVLWGVGTFRADQALYAASVNGDEISPKDVRRAAQQLERFYQKIYGEHYSPELAKALDFKSRALDQMINSALFRQAAQRLGLSVSEEEVRSAIAGIEGLSVDGRFQREVYFRFLRMQGMTPVEFENDERSRLLVEKMQNLVTSSVHTDEGTARDLYEFANEKVNLSFVRVKAADLVKEIPIAEGAIADYFEKHKDSFREPERVTIDYVAYTANAFEPAVEVTDADVQEEYQEERQRYTEPEQVHARHILLRVPPGADAAAKKAIHDRAAAALERVKKGEDFAAVAKAVSEDPSNKDKGGDLGFFPRGRMEEAFETAAFGLKPGETSDLVETRYGFHIIRVDEHKPERVKPLDEVRASIVATIRHDRARNLARDAAFGDAEKAAAGTKLEELAAAHGLEPKSPPAFAENESIVGLARQPELVHSAFSTPVGAVGPVTQNADAFVLFRVKKKDPAHIPDLKEIESRVEDAYRQEKAAEKALAAADALRAELAKNLKLEEVAAAAHLAVEETGPFTRTGEYVPRMGNVPGLKKAAFALKPQSPIAPRTFASGGDAFVVALKERVPADMAEFERKKDEILKQTLDDQRQAALQAFLNELKRRADIRVNQQALSQA